jgi:hypothetical protein
MIIELKVRESYSFEVLVSASCHEGKMRYTATLAELGALSVINPRDPGQGDTIEEAIAGLALQLSEAVDRLFAV